jgi:predicted TIM-barrel fold metal-dependent hydrolase
LAAVRSGLAIRPDAAPHLWTLQPIRRDYPIEEYLADARPAGVVKSVYVQTNWPPGGETDEAAWIQSVSDRNGLPQAFVGYADLASPALEGTLDALMKHRGLRGIRQQLHWHENAAYRFASRPDLMNDASWRARGTLPAEAVIRAPDLRQPDDGRRTVGA